MGVPTLIDHFREKQYLPLKTNPRSDGCSAQFRSRFIFKLLASVNSSLNTAWRYNKRHHGQGPNDSIEGTFFSQTENLTFKIFT